MFSFPSPSSPPLSLSFSLSLSLSLSLSPLSLSSSPLFTFCLLSWHRSIAIDISANVSNAVTVVAGQTRASWNLISINSSARAFSVVPGQDTTPLGQRTSRGAPVRQCMKLYIRSSLEGPLSPLNETKCRLHCKKYWVKFWPARG